MRTRSKCAGGIACAPVERLEDRRLFAADLTGSFVGVLPSSLKVTGLNHVTVQLSNAGTSPASGSATVSLYVSSDTSLDSGDTALLPIAKRNIRLNPGAVLNVPMTFASPTGVATGAYYLLADITAISDMSTANTVVHTPNTLSIQQPFVDLTDAVVKGLTGTITVVAKHPKSQFVTVTVTNVGNVTATGKLTVNLYDATGTTLNDSDTLLLSKALGAVAIPAGKTRRYVLVVTPNASDPSGTFYLLADVNPSGVITESNTANNVSASAGTFVLNNPAIPPGPRLGGALSVDLPQVMVGQSEEVHFSVPITGATSSTAAEVDELDASGNTLGELTPLVDNGNLVDGDAIAGDGIYSGVINVDFSAPGTRYFVATVNDPSLVSSLQTATVSVAGVNAPTMGQLQTDESDQQSIAAVADAATSAGDSTQDVLSTVNAALQTDPNVITGSIMMGNGVIEWTDVDGTLKMVDTTYASETAAADASPAAASPASTPVMASLASTTPAAVATPADDTLPQDATKNALILSPFGYDLDTNNAAATISTQLQGDGLEVTSYINATPTSNRVTQLNFTGFSQYGFIDINSHGMLSPDGNVYIATGEPDSLAAAVNYVGELADHSVITATVPKLGSFFAIAPSFITKNDSGMNHAIVYAGVCYGAANDSMANAFRQAGAAAYISFDNTVSNQFVLAKQAATVSTLVANTMNTVGDIPGINRDHDYKAPNALFVSRGNIMATLPQANPLYNTELYILYSWPQNEADLDTNTGYLGSTVGYNLPGGPYLNWSGDNVGDGGTESVIVDIAQAYADGKWTESTTISYGADWYTPHGGMGNATVTVGLEDMETGEIYDVSMKSVSPGQETHGSTTVFGNITVYATGAPSAPTVNYNW